MVKGFIIGLIVVIVVLVIAIIVIGIKKTKAIKREDYDAASMYDAMDSNLIISLYMATVLLALVA
jgi:hypothetical protein